MARLHFGRTRSDVRLTHYLFRFPAKFHAPVARYLLKKHTKIGQRVLDPFCGSGTLLVEALVAGRNATGVDVDPLAAFISRVKSRPLDPKNLEKAFERLLKRLASKRRSTQEYDRRMFADLSTKTYRRHAKGLAVPAIPNIEHWFRRYVIIDLARIRQTIERSHFDKGTREFFLACFASILRNSSNADPVPVSGLEVTAHMRRRDKEGRRIDPFKLFELRSRREIAGMSQLWERAKDVKAAAKQGDATRLSKVLGKKNRIDVVITSPPYNTAVDYYRRHMLEMFWLRLVTNQNDRIELSRHYLGRTQVLQNDPRTQRKFTSAYISRLISTAGKISRARARAVSHYCASIENALAECAKVLRPRGKAIFVVGNSTWNGKKVRASRTIVELAKPHFRLSKLLSYRSQNRYMSYARRNGADVNWEHVIVLRKQAIYKKSTRRKVS